ncbi:protein chup1, chloroplastic [Fagus crenata]
MAVDSLQDERKKLHEEIKQGFVAEKQLETAKNMLKGLQDKMDANPKHVKGRLIMLQEQVSRFQSDEISFRDTNVVKKLENVKDVELEIAEMKRRNKELELEKRELAVKLVVAKERIAALSNMTEGKIMARVKEEVSTLRHANKELQEQVKRLQEDRFDMVEALVCQRWIHTCLRFEIENHENQTRNTSKCDPRKDSSKKSHEKTEPVMSDPGFDSNFSNSSTESDEMDSTTIDSSPSSQRSSTKRFGAIHNIKRTGIFRRFSMSISPSSPPMPRKNGISTVGTLCDKTEVQDSTKSIEKPTSHRARRVSFNDSVTSVESTYQSMPNSIKEMLEEKEISPVRFGHSATINSGPICSNKLDEVKHEPSSATLIIVKDGLSSGTIGELINNDSINMNEGRRIEIAGDELHSKMPEVLPLENRAKSKSHVLVHLVAALFFIFMLRVYFLHLSARNYSA